MNRSRHDAKSPSIEDPTTWTSKRAEWISSNTKSGVVGRWESGEKCHWCSQLGAQVGVGKESKVVLKVGVQHCSRQCSRGESTRESDVVLALMHEWKESGERDDGRA